MDVLKIQYIRVIIINIINKNNYKCISKICFDKIIKQIETNKNNKTQQPY